MSAEQSPIATLIGEGDYFEALGVAWDSTPTDIAVTAARLAGEHPQLARRINAVASVLRDPRQREIYVIARQERDNVLRRAIEPRLRAAVPDLRRRVWAELQRLLRCEFELGAVRIGPRGARSLAQRHEWIREAVVNSAFPVVVPSPDARRFGAVQVKIFQRDCTRCGGLGEEGCDCQDEYRFDIPSGAAPGTLLGAYGERTGRFYYVILDRPVLAPRPYHALNAIYVAHRLGTPLGDKADLTVEEAQEWVSRQYLIFLVVYAAVGALVGLLVSSWRTGLLVTMVGAAIPGLRLLLVRDTMKWSRASLAAALVIQPIVGAFAPGRAHTSTTSGLLTGLIPSLLPAALLVVSRRRPI